MTSDVTWSGSMPEVYDRLLGPITFQPYADHLAGLATRLQPARVLELAAGTGLVTSALISALPTATVTATDLNAGMVDYGRAQVPAATWRTADAQEVPFADSSFDLVVCQFGVMFFPDKARAYAEMARVLEPGGRCLFSSWDVLSTSSFETAVLSAAATVLPEDPPSFLERVPHGYADPDRIRADVCAAGFEVESLERVVLTATAPSAGTVAEGYCLGSPLRFELEERGSLAELTAAIAEVMTERLGAGPVTGEMAAFIVTGRTD